MTRAAPLQNAIDFNKVAHTGLLQRKCACGGSGASALSGECEGCKEKRLQRKLSIGASNDPLELEADRVADQVMSMSPSSGVSRAPLRIQRFTGEATADVVTTPVSVDRALASSGRALDPAFQQNMGQRLGYDFSRVRVHTGATAERSAREVNAKAYTVGHNIVFGSSQFAPETSEGLRLLAHELTYVVQQNSGIRPVIQRDVVDDVRKKLSYGFFDWVITDAEAIDSMALLSKIPQPDLPAALTRLGAKYVRRLLDNLPDASKSGTIYQRLIVALGSAGTMGYANDLLSYGIFDWAITDAEVARVFNLFANLPAAERGKFLAGLDKAGKLGRLISNASIGDITMYLVPWMKTLKRGRLNEAQRSIMRAIVAETPTSSVDILKLATEVRYDVAVGPMSKGLIVHGRKPTAWSGEKLRSLYLAIDHLPEAHTARNKSLLRFGQYRQPDEMLAGGRLSTTSVAGYSSTAKELALNIKTEGFAREEVVKDMLHEIGHAVDTEMGWSKGREPTKPKRGGWKTYLDHKVCATDMVNDSNGGIKNKLNQKQRTDVIKIIATAMGKDITKAKMKGLDYAYKVVRKELVRNIRNSSWFAKLPDKTKSSVLKDKVLIAVPIGLISPWETFENGGLPLGGKKHIYQEGNFGAWVRYQQDARKRIITRYQFHTPRDWFAECYAAYYDPENKVKGEKLEKKDADTKRYFDDVVDKYKPKELKISPAEMKNKRGMK